jgi:hypothetical protein
MNGWKLEGKADDFESALSNLAENAFAEFPRSTFATWWAGIAMPSGAITMGYVAQHLPMITVECDRCG